MVKRALVGVVGAVTAAIVVHAYGVATDPFAVGDPLHNSAPISVEQLERGKALRGEIDAIYVDMRARGALQPMRRNSVADRNRIAGVVAKYVRLESSFDDAEAVLRAAGCVIAYPEHSEADGYVRAKGVIERHLLGTNLISVSLSPRTPGDYAVVTALSAEFELRSL